MSLTPNDAKLAYELIMGRTPSDEEVNALTESHPDVASVRASFLGSDEFTRKYKRFYDQLIGVDNPALVHLHIPKTAGTTMAEALSAVPRLQPNITVHDHNLDELRNMPRGQRRALRYVRGHLSLGAGQALGSAYRYMCLIRRPGPRIFSFYQFIMRTRTHPDFATFTERKLSFGDYLEYSVDAVPHRLEIDNGQIRHLAGQFNHTSIGQEAQLLRTALHTALDPDMLFGFVEHTQAFVALLKSEGYLPGDADVPAVNVSPNSDLYQAAVDTLTPAQQEIFSAYTAWDAYFYDVCHGVLNPANNDVVNDEGTRS